jgi:stage II sporulation protein D
VIGRAAFLKSLLVATGGLDIWDTPSPTPAVPPPTGAPTIRVATLGGIQTLDLESYLCGVVPLEAAPSWPAAALEAQAIVARTYALAKRDPARPYDLQATDADQRYGGPSAEHPASTAAVQATRGQTLGYFGGPVSIFYSACCGGHTADAVELWGHADLPYLRGVSDPYCSACPDYRWQHALPLDRVRAALAERLPGVPVTAIVSDPDDSGRPRSVVFRSDTAASATFTVAELRSRFGTSVVLSLWLQRLTFDVTTQAGASVVIEGSGRGHGVGLCQWGARGMALAGADAPTILAHYFPGTAVTGG